MSRFGDRTPAQEMYEWIECVKNAFGLSDRQVAIVLIKLAEDYISDSVFEFESIQGFIKLDEQRASIRRK